MPAKTTRPIGPYSRPDRLAKLDGRTKEARMMQQTRADLIAHVGGRPSATQMAMIEEAAKLTLRLSLMDRATFAAGGWPLGRDGRAYLGWSNSLIRLLGRLGTKPAPARIPSVAELLAQPVPAARPAPRRAPQPPATP